MSNVTKSFLKSENQSSVHNGEGLMDVDEDIITSRGQKRVGSTALTPSVISLKAINLTSDLATLKHQNRQLFSQVKILKRKQVSKETELAKCNQENEILVASDAILLKNWNLLNRQLLQFMSPNDAHAIKKPKLEYKMVVKSVADLIVSLSEEIEKRTDVVKSSTDSLSAQTLLEHDNADLRRELKLLDDTFSNKVAFSTDLISMANQIEITTGSNVSNSRLKSSLGDENEKLYQRAKFLENCLAKEQFRFEQLENQFEHIVQRLNQYSSLQFLSEDEKNILSNANGNSAGAEKKDEKNSTESEIIKSEDIPHEIESLQNKIDDLSDLLSARESAIEKLSATSKELASDLHKARFDLTKLEDVKLKYREPLSEAFKELVENSSLYVGKVKELRQKESEYFTQQREMNRLKHDKAVAEEKLATAMDKFKEFENGLAVKFEEDLYKEKKRVYEVENKLTELLVKYTKAKETIKVMEKKMSVKDKESASDEYIKKAKESLQKHYVNLHKELKKSCEEAIELRKFYKEYEPSLQEKLELAKHAKAAAEEEISSLRAQVDHLKKLNMDSEQRAEKVLDDISRVSAESAAKDATVQLLHNQMAKLQDDNTRLELRNGDMAKARETILSDKQVLEDENAKLKDRIKKYRMQTSASTEEADRLRMQAMETALRCPVNTQLWKNCMLKRCYHMFSRQVINETLSSRNRKCPTCKTPFDQGDVVTIYLYNPDEDQD